MRIKKKLYWDLILRYVVFLLASILVTGLFISTLIIIVINTISEHPEVAKDLNIYFKNIEYDDRTKELNLPADIDENAWVEILKDNKVVYIKGKKQDGKMEYTQEDLALIANDVDEVMANNEFVYEYIPFTGLDGESYTFLYKKPKMNTGVFKVGFSLPTSLQGTDFEREINTKVKLVFFIFMLLISTIVMLFSRITSKKIITPLKELNKGLQSVMDGNLYYKARF